jgi:hypothetical protein
MAYIGNSPGVASQRIVSKFTATASQTTFTPTSGYTVGYLDVYLNGVKLINGEDYTASNGSTFVLASGAASGDIVESVAYLPRGLSDGYTRAEADARYMDINSVPTPAAVSDAANSSTGYFALPAGTTAQRPGSPAEGMTRYNETNGTPEWYDSSSSSWKPFSDSEGYPIEVLIIGGGGGSGQDNGGGGGAGGYIEIENFFVTSGYEYSVVVGGGGAAKTDGANSSFGNLTAIGGGRGSTSAGSGASGGSGGGGGFSSGAGATGTGKQGNDGGNGSAAGYGGGGGGGAGANGSTAGTNIGGNGGAGRASSITGSSVTRAGGGGGGGNSTGGSGGSGGGGAGSGGSGVAGNNATANTGSGAGGGSGYQGVGASGGSGIVIIRYPGSQTGTGGTVTSARNSTVHTFTSSGTFTA